jgi:hypothetical protein
MKRIVGNEVGVFLKSSIGSDWDIFGILIDVTEDSLYIQCSDTNSPEIYIVPRDNVKYCTTKYLPSVERIISKTTVNSQPEIVCETKEEKQPDSLDVYINSNMIAKIPVPPTFNLSVCSDDIIRIIMGNPEVILSLGGKMQKSLEYYPGKVYIEVDEENIEQIVDKQIVDTKENISNNRNTFVMSGDAATQFLNPSQMISRLNAAANRGKKNGG